MPRRNENTASAPDVAQLISRQIRYAENARFLRRMPGFELQREMPDRWLELLHELHEAEAHGHRMKPAKVQTR